jgi:TDG/mug DNA glycosylase family protein
LPDLLRPGLKLVICGSAAGRRSAEVGAYYAGPGNKFWRILHESGLTPRRLAPEEFRALLDHGIGLTDLAKAYAGGDAGIRRADDDVDGLTAKIARHTPRWLGFNGKRAAQAVLGRRIDYGLQAECLARSRLFVLPSTAGAASGHWDAAPWHELAGLLRG